MPNVNQYANYNDKGTKNNANRVPLSDKNAYKFYYDAKAYKLDASGHIIITT